MDRLATCRSERAECSRSPMPVANITATPAASSKKTQSKVRNPEDPLLRLRFMIMTPLLSPLPGSFNTLATGSLSSGAHRRQCFCAPRPFRGARASRVLAMVSSPSRTFLTYSIKPAMRRRGSSFRRDSSRVRELITDPARANRKVRDSAKAFGVASMRDACAT